MSARHTVGIASVGFALAAASAQAQPPIVVAQVQAPVKPQGATPPLKQGPKQSAPTPAGPPYSVTAPQLSVTGTGALSPAVAFAPLTFTAPGLSVTGTGALATAAPFPPKSLTAPSLTVTGTGALR